MTVPTTIQIDGVEYVRADSIPATPLPNLTADWVLVRSKDAGVFVGVLTHRKDDEVQLTDARRIWYWDGAATLSELAMKGTSKPENCKFPQPVPFITVLGVCEVIPMTTQAVESIAGVKVWSEHAEG